MRSTKTLGVLAAVAAALLLCSCSASDEGGFGLPTLAADAAGDALRAAGAMAADLEGSLVVGGNGCFRWSSDDGADGAWVVWPRGWKQDADHVVTDSGQTIGDGASLVGNGARIALADLPDGDDADSYFGAFGGFCKAEESGVVVLTSARTR